MHLFSCSRHQCCWCTSPGTNSVAQISVISTMMNTIPSESVVQNTNPSSQQASLPVSPISSLHCWQGAEAKVTLFEYATGINAIHKFRLSKSYRHPLLDARILKQRLTQEIRCTHRVRSLAKRNLVHVPAILGVFSECVVMEYINDNIIAKDFLKNNDNVPNDNVLKVLGEAIGMAVGEMHNVDVIHGDLTTSNLLINPQQIHTRMNAFESKTNNKLDINNSFEAFITLIDFGLAQVSKMVEDRAVDLYVLERAFLSTHSKYAKVLMDSVLDGYKCVNNTAQEVIVKYEEVRMRGRKRTMVG